MQYEIVKIKKETLPSGAVRVLLALDGYHVRFNMPRDPRTGKERRKGIIEVSAIDRDFERKICELGYAIAV